MINKRAFFFRFRKTKGCGKELGSLVNWVDYRTDTRVFDTNIQMSIPPNSLYLIN